jgi:hypothetical protein
MCSTKGPVIFVANTGVTFHLFVREHDVTAWWWISALWLKCLTRPGVHVCVQRTVANTDFSLVGLSKCQSALVDGSNSNFNRSRSNYWTLPNISYWFGAVTTLYKSTSWSRGPYDLRRRSAGAWLLGLRVRISLRAGLFVPWVTCR